MYENTFPHRRFQLTLEFLKKHVGTHESILDLGVDNPFSKLMKLEGFQVENTTGQDLDDDLEQVEMYEGDVVTAFEIFEHLVAPYHVLKKTPCEKLLVSV
ncbi:MAG: methyltransferase, partial [Nonlabens sp.]